MKLIALHWFAQKFQEKVNLGKYENLCLKKLKIKKLEKGKKTKTL